MTIGDFSLPPREAIARWRDKQFTGAALMRSLVSYNQWLVPVSEAAVGEMLQRGTASGVLFSRDAQGVSRLFIFSDGEAYDEFRRAAGAAGGQHFVTTKGTWVFQLPTEELDFVAIDPNCPHGISYSRDQFPDLREVAAAVEVEAALADLRAGAGEDEELLPLVRDYQGYRVAVKQSGGRPQVVLAPDQKGRRLAAVFTSEEAADAFAEQDDRPPPEGALLWLSLPGAQLFGQLAGLPIDGMVFNCMGPPQPVAFAAQFAELVLNTRQTGGPRA